MADLLYCGTNPVGPDDTQAMLASKFRAIWSPPMHRHAPLRAGDRIWLLWRAAEGAALLLGGGVVVATSEGKVDWTNRTAPGIVVAADNCGYGGPTNMAFLRLTHVRLPGSHVAMPKLGVIPIGLSAASPSQATELQAMLPLGS